MDKERNNCSTMILGMNDGELSFWFHINLLPSRLELYIFQYIDLNTVLSGQICINLILITSDLGGAKVSTLICL